MLDKSISPNDRTAKRRWERIKRLNSLMGELDPEARDWTRREIQAELVKINRKWGVR